jgi:hypothetical protein
MMSPATAARWFKRIVWIGIFANLALAFPTLAAPTMVIEMASLPTATPDLWPRFAALLLVLLSVFYMPAAVDPDRYRANAWFAVGSRLVGVVFFVLHEPAYRMLGLFDLVFFVPEAVLLYFMVRAQAPAATAPARASAV